MSHYDSTERLIKYNFTLKLQQPIYWDSTLLLGN